MQKQFVIHHSWDGVPVGHDPVSVVFSPGKDGLKMEAIAPFFNDPSCPPGQRGLPFPGLWDYEVVESFFLDSTTGNYLEVELCPHGQHLILLLSGVRQVLQEKLPLKYNSTIEGEQWVGEAILPWSYFPPNVNKMNCYAIHGSGEKRAYEALYPVPREELVHSQGPDFHRLEYFQNFKLQSIMGDGWVQPESELWQRKS